MKHRCGETPVHNTYIDKRFDCLNKHLLNGLIDSVESWERRKAVEETQSAPNTITIVYVQWSVNAESGLLLLFIWLIWTKLTIANSPAAHFPWCQINFFNSPFTHSPRVCHRSLVVRVWPCSAKHKSHFLIGWNVTMKCAVKQNGTWLRADKMLIIAKQTKGFRWLCKY